MRPRWRRRRSRGRFPPCDERTPDAVARAFQRSGQKIQEWAAGVGFVRVLGLIWIGVILAGCAETIHTAAPGPTLPALAEFADCPSVAGAVVPCMPEGNSPADAIVRDDFPPGWTCLTFSDERDDPQFPMPAWYTHYGPFVSDGLPDGSSAFGVSYDAAGDVERVSGVLQLVSEEDSPTFVWEGPARGFVIIPWTITQTRVLAFGALYPALGEEPAGRFDHARSAPRFAAEGEPDVQAVQPFWSLGPLDKDGGWSGWGEDAQWNVVQNMQMAGQEAHFATDRNRSIGFGDSADLAGTAHWGHGRESPFVMDIEGEGFRTSATLQPYLEFYVEARDLEDPVTLAGYRFLCGCYGEPLTSVQGVFCAIGVPPPMATIVASPDGRHKSMTLG